MSHPRGAGRGDGDLEEHAVAVGVGAAQAEPELLLPIAKAHGIPLDELVASRDVGDPRVGPRPQKRGNRIVVPLTEQPRGVHAWKVVIQPERKQSELRTHEGYEWLYVLSGELRLIIADHDITMKAGEVAEFDTRAPHWFGAAGDRPVEILSILGREGERIHVRAAPRRKTADR